MRKKLLSASKKLLQHELIQGSTYLFLGTFIANVFAFVFNLLIIRKLTYAEYGIYASLIALFTLLSIPSGSLVPVIVKFATEFLSKNENEKAKELFVITLRNICVFLGLFLLLFLCSSSFIGVFLGVTNIWLLLLVAAIVIVVYLSIINTAFLQSLLRFDFLAGTIILGGVIRVVVGFIILILGFRLYGVLFALVLTFFIPYLLTFLPLKKILSYKSAHAKIPIGEIFKYGLSASFSTLFLSSLISTDVLLVKHFFSPTLAGIYAGLSLVGKIILYFTSPIPQVMFPLLIKRVTKGEETISLFILASILVLLPSLFLTVIYFLFPQIILSIFSGGKGYVAASSYLGIFATFITLYSLLNVLVSFFLSTNRTKIVAILLAGAVIQIISIFLFHSNFMQIILASTIITLVMLIVLLLYYGKVYGSKKKISPIILNSTRL